MDNFSGGHPASLNLSHPCKNERIRKSHRAAKGDPMRSTIICVVVFNLSACFSPTCDTKERATGFYSQYQESDFHTREEILDRRRRLKRDIESDIAEKGIEETIRTLSAVVGLKCESSIQPARIYICQGTHQSNWLHMDGRCIKGAYFSALIRIRASSKSGEQVETYDVEGQIVAQ